jgi:hypothetical protein
MNMNVDEVLLSINKYIKNLEEKVLFLTREKEALQRENNSLKDNEKEMFKVSSIISASNENTKLKSYISILENQNKKLRTKETVEETVFIEEEHEVEVIVEKEEVFVDVVEEKVSNVIEELEEEVLVEEVIDIVEEEVLVEEVIDIVEEEVLVEEVIDIVEEEVSNEVSNVVEELEEEVVEEIETKEFKYKGSVYLIDTSNQIYENNNGTIGEMIGKRIHNPKNNKFKTVFN